jgi:peptidoglycan/LPS O-acetylase OafA/YrhL
MKDYPFSPDISKENSFDFFRLLFAFSVFVAHFGLLTPHDTSWFPVTSGMGVGGFFIISGFLITRSYYKSKNLRDYTVKRIRRIVPAYMLIVLCCAVFLSLLSSLSLPDYFSNKDFFNYLAANVSFLNFVQPALPEVFTNNLLPYVNASLWTIKVEICLYAFVPILALCIKRKPGFLFAVLYVLSFLFIWYMDILYEASAKKIYEILSRQFFGQIRFFISGVALLFYFDWLKRQWKWLLPVACVAFSAIYFAHLQVIDFLYPFAFAVIIISSAYLFSRLKAVARFGDFSYGVYLFHFPIIQAIVHLGWFRGNPFLLFTTCFAIILLLSCLSWHLLEKRVLKRANPKTAQP